MMTHTYFTMVFQHDKAGMHASIKMLWTENRELGWYFAQIHRVHKGQDSHLAFKGKGESIDFCFYLAS